MSNKERKLNAIRFAGDTPEDEKLWYTYVYLALEKARFGQTKDKTKILAVVDKQNKRVKDSLSFALQLIVFSAFALEYRLKRVLIKMGVKRKSEKNLKLLLDIFWGELKKRNQLNKEEKCFQPPEWNSYDKDLKQLAELRDKIVHANYREILSSFPEAENSLKKARQYYRSFIEAMRLINKGTGYQTCSDEKAKKDIKPLLVW